ncbi:hypothetical protein RO3G_06957 [Rhizopus delemar RA 99-880]|uniref:Acyl-CoA dehydrogenase/oxidase C-terminal domain-containing protein n=1 Tax=Rhizopus delemar (strain RA 99-880 / ATCC MYA-4621 / FGSC 9543 / NRRL 43880) TaxID=246409 RepID=I1C1C2_RHIO9|nr:hypothetical protein RO3G_06957 [Rhizopus delemar RA 99-880]|eukprot:EIE82252.1 hypothetical protein RO3G_06957 [Rhizopus delemar RA 99-880]
MPKSILDSIEPDLSRFGERVIGDILAMGDDVEDPNNYPRLKQYDAWCRRVDEITTAKGWKELNDVAAEEGLIAIAYERKYNEYSRIYQFAKQYLYSPSAAMYSCPLSMTGMIYKNGAARVIELLGTQEMKETIYSRLISRDPKLFWTSGQWMTERPGGSDVSRSETVAELVDPSTNTWSVSGFKWFSSATTADIAMLLARTVDPKQGTVQPGSKGLSLFVAKMRNPDGSLNGVHVHRLKNKFGTKGLPTAELELVGMKATMMGNPGRGVPNIASILNISRIYASLGVVSYLRRSLAIAKDFSLKRQVFNQTLDKVPLHVTTLAGLELTFRACIQIVFCCIELLGRAECQKATKEDLLLLRLLTPISKCYVCKIGVQAISEAMEALGGQGYMDDTGLGRLLRDGQVNMIWEGTTNVMAVDVLRVMRETKNGCLTSFKKVIEKKVKESTQVSDQLTKPGQAIHTALANIDVFLQSASDQLEANARQLTFALGRVLAGALLVEQAAFGLSHQIEGADQDLFAAQQWCIQPDFVQQMTPVIAHVVNQEAKMVYGPNAKI